MAKVPADRLTSPVRALHESLRHVHSRGGRPPRALIVVAYDVSDDRRRDRVARFLADHGCRVQFSVFECELTDRELEMLKTTVSGLVESRTDRVAYYRLCGPCAGRTSALPARRLTIASTFLV